MTSEGRGTSPAHYVTAGPSVSSGGYGAWCSCGKKWVGFQTEDAAKARAELHLRVATTINGDPHGR